MKRTVLGCCLSIAVFGFAARAGAQTPEEGPNVGDQGHWSLSIDRAFGFDYLQSKPQMNGVSEGTSSSTTFSLFGNPAAGSASAFSFPRLAFDAFVGSGVSVGAGLGLFHLSQSLDETGTTLVGADESATGFIIAPRIGYVGRLNPLVAIWPRLGASVSYASTDITPTGGSQETVSLYAVAVTAEVPFVFTLAPHAAVTLGPTFDYSFAGKSTLSQPGAGSASTDEHLLEFGVQAGLVITL
jgi:hypothetical protein